MPGQAAGPVSSWCIATIFADGGDLQPVSVTANGCDVRTVLQEKSGDNFIADDMSAQVSCDANCSDLITFNVHVDYSFPADNNVVHLKPLSASSAGCTPVSGSFSWFGIGFSWSETIRDGVITPEGPQQRHQHRRPPAAAV